MKNGRMSIKHLIKRKIQKVVINSKRKIICDTSTVKNDNEDNIISICRNLIKNKSTELLICPISGKRYIINKKLETYIVISDRAIDLVNKKHLFNNTICLKSYDIILTIFNGHVEMRRKELEEKIFADVKQSLDTIREEIKQDLTETNRY